MRFLIRICCFLIYVAIVTAIRIEGFILGAIPTIVLFLLWCSCSEFLCNKLGNKWDIKAFEKAAAKKGMTPGAYALTVFPPSLIEICAANKDNKTEFDRLLKQSIKGEVITKSEANVLLHMFNVGSWH